MSGFCSLRWESCRAFLDDFYDDHGHVFLATLANTFVGGHEVVRKGGGIRYLGPIGSSSFCLDIGTKAAPDFPHGVPRFGMLRPFFAAKGI